MQTNVLACWVDEGFTVLAMLLQAPPPFYEHEGAKSGAREPEQKPGCWELQRSVVRVGGGAGCGCVRVAVGRRISALQFPSFCNLLAA